MKNIDSETIATYNAKAQEYADLVSSESPSRLLQAFITALPSGGQALDLGCGPGNSAALMREAGLIVTAIDASPGMVEMGRKKYGLDIQLGTFDDVTQVAEFDGIWASFSLLHAPREEIPRYLKAIHTALKPKGIFMIGVKTGSGDNRDSLGRQYTYFEVEELDNLLCAAGFTVVSSQQGVEKGLSGTLDPWIFVTTHA